MNVMRELRETRVLRKRTRNLWKSIARNRVRLAKLERKLKKLREVEGEAEGT